jgi:hypothetical protein
MLLKAAYFRAMGFGANTIILSSDRDQARGEWQLYGLAQKPRQHELSGWAHLLVGKRVALGVPHPAGVGRQIVNQAQTIQDHWLETARYYSTPVYRHELASVRSAVRWFHQNNLIL